MFVRRECPSSPHARATRAFLSPSPPPHSNSNSLPISSCRLSIFLMKIESILSSSLFPRIHFRWGQGGEAATAAGRATTGLERVKAVISQTAETPACDDPVSPRARSAGRPSPFITACIIIPGADAAPSKLFFEAVSPSFPSSGGAASPPGNFLFGYGRKDGCDRGL